MAKAARQRRRLVAIDPLAKALEPRLARTARILAKDVMAELLDGILERIAARAPSETKAAGDDVIFRETKALDALFADYVERTGAVLDDAGVSAYQASARKTLASLGADVSFTLRNPDVLAAIQTRKMQLAGKISKSVREGLRDTIRDVFWDQRKGVPEVAKALREKFDILSSSRAENIAHTETMIDVSQATQETFVRSGVERKRWGAAIASPTPPRPEHRAANNQVVAVDDPFIIGGYEMMHPGDSTLGAPPEMICRCRCFEDAVITEPIPPEDFWTGE